MQRRGWERITEPVKRATPKSPSLHPHVIWALVLVWVYEVPVLAKAPRGVGEASS
jgi:hypothetical protein